jgi:hypothetical protein
MASGKSLELAKIEKPAAKPYCLKRGCNLEWTDHFTKKGEWRKKLDEATHLPSSAQASITALGPRFRYAPRDDQDGPAARHPMEGLPPALGRNRRRRAKIHPMKLERAKRAYDAIMELEKPSG